MAPLKGRRLKNLSNRPFPELFKPGELEQRDAVIMDERRRIFAAAFAKTFNLRESCEAANVTEYQGRKWLKEDEEVVLPWVREAVAGIVHHYDLSDDHILQEIAAVAFSNIADFTVKTSKGQILLDVVNTTDHHMRAVKKIGPDGLQFHDKVRALELLGQWRKLFRKEGSDEQIGAPPTLTIQFVEPKP